MYIFKLFYHFTLFIVGVVGFFNFAYGNNRTNLHPYTVIGTACAEHEHCRQALPPMVGYQVKSNIPLNDNRQSDIRNNMITKSVLDKEVKKCREKVADNISSDNPVCQRMIGVDPSNNDSGPFRKMGKRCGPNVMYCKKITSGPYAGLVEKSNISGHHPEYSNIPITLTPTAERQCIRNGVNANCGKNSPAVPDNEVFVRIGMRCGPYVIYCQEIAEGRFAGFMRKSNILPSDPRFNKTAVVVSNVFQKCKPHLFNTVDRRIILNTNEERPSGGTQ